MPESKRNKQIVAVLLPLFFLLVGIVTVYQKVPLKAEDQNYQLVDVKYNGEKVNVDSTFSDEVNPIEISSKETQILKFKGSDNYGVNAVDEKGNVLPSKELTPEELVEYVDFIEKKETRQASGETESSDKVAEKKI